MRKHNTLSVSERVEEIRKSGDDGRELRLMQLPKCWATRAIGVRQLELAVSQMAAPWVEGVMEEEELWSFLHSNLLSHVVECADVLAETQSNPAAPAEDVCENADVVNDNYARAVSSLLKALRLIQGSERRYASYGCCVMVLLVSSMILRQYLEDRLKIHARPRGEFAMNSSNVAEQFLTRSLSRLGWRPFDIRQGEPLAALVQQISTGVEDELRRGAR